jgi:outer membrane lipoprotein-sorting protein
MTFRIVSVACTVAFLGALAWGVPVSRTQQAAGNMDAARLLVEETARAVQSIDRFEVAHQVDVTSVTPHYNQTTHAYVKTWVQRPGHIRAESQQYVRKETIVSDGSTLWVYDGTNQTYWKRAGGAPPQLFSNAFPGLARQLSSTNLPSVMRSAKLVGTEALTVTGRSYPCDVVEVSVAPDATPGVLQNNTLRLWISREYKIPLKVEATFVGATPQAIKTYSDFVTDFEPNLSIPVSTWTFSPPAGAKLQQGAAQKKQ